MKQLIAMCLVLLAACSSGVQAPAVEPATEFCTDAFCLESPDGWGGEVGDTFLAFNHAADPDNTYLTGSVIDMEAIVTSAGGTWPVPTDDVVRSFWSLLEDAGEGSLTRTQRMIGGAVQSWGTHSSGDMWFVVVPIEGSRAIGVEIRGPNSSWKTHADAVFPTIRPIP
ncbi:MAG: hypothetical protein ACR2N7_01055 [Acidimicrobiia bacterium]